MFKLILVNAEEVLFILSTLSKVVN